MTDHRYSGASPHGVTKISFPLYQRYPLLGAFVKRPGLAAMFGYFALIAAASSLQWSWLPQWLQLWTPLLDIMRKIFPVFDNMDQLLSAKGFGHRGAVVNHLFMAGWLYTVPRLIISTAAVVSVSRKEWIRWASSIPVRSCLFFYLAAAVFAFASFGSIVFGYWVPDERPLFAFHRFDFALFMISTLFYVAYMSAFGLEIFSVALLLTWQRNT
jgi:hypothetical protein